MIIILAREDVKRDKLVWPSTLKSRGLLVNSLSLSGGTEDSTG